MRIDTRCKRIRDSVGHVQRRMPKRDRAAVEGMVVRVLCERAWQMFGLSGRLNRASAELNAHFKSIQSMRSEIEAGTYRAYIRFFLPVCRLYSDKALLGVVAHEFAHAVRAVAAGSHWLDKMQSEEEEVMADKIATTWGFGRGITAMRRERLRVIEPWIDKREGWLLRRIAQREKREVQAIRERFGLSRGQFGLPLGRGGPSNGNSP